MLEMFWYIKIKCLKKNHFVSMWIRTSEVHWLTWEPNCLLLLQYCWDSIWWNCWIVICSHLLSFWIVYIGGPLWKKAEKENVPRFPCDIICWHWCFCHPPKTLYHFIVQLYPEFLLLDRSFTYFLEEVGLHHQTRLAKVVQLPQWYFFLSFLNRKEQISWVYF